MSMHTQARGRSPYRAVIASLLALALFAATLALSADRSAASGFRKCGGVIVTPQSDNGFTQIKAKHLRCRKARRIAKHWAKKGYKGDGPKGWNCRGSGHGSYYETRCRRHNKRLVMRSGY